jgi:hypothetical protein
MHLQRQPQIKQPQIKLQRMQLQLHRILHSQKPQLMPLPQLPLQQTQQLKR